VRQERVEDVEPRFLSFGSLADHDSDPLTGPLHPNARRFDLSFVPSSAGAWAVASLELFEEAGWDWIHEQAATLAAQLSEMLTERGRDVEPRGRSTLVSWRDDDCEATYARLRESGVVVRFIPGRNLVRASVGAWSDESDLERLVAALT
jgi:L-cysteine/cystine lyase